MKIKVATPQINLKELVSSRLSEFDIYHMYLGEFKLNTVMKSPFHRDRHPSFSIGTSTSGRLYWRDYSADEKGGAVDMVQKMYNLTYSQALQKICSDFGLLVADGLQYRRIISSYVQPVIEKHDTLIHVKAGKWTKKALEYWSAYGIDQQQLEREEIYNVDEWYLNRMRQEKKPGENVFAYRFPGDLFKLYMPDRTRDEGRWKTNVPCATVEGLDRLNKSPKVLVAKSRKDRVVLQQIVPYTVLSVQNEGISAWTDEFRQRLQGKEVIICYDADEPGVRNCKKICDAYGYRYVNTPRHLISAGVKDPSDWYKHEGSNEALKRFMQEKNVI
jgi:CHC2 zinc finger